MSFGEHDRGCIVDFILGNGQLSQSNSKAILQKIEAFQEAHIAMPSHHRKLLDGELT